MNSNNNNNGHGQAPGNGGGAPMAPPAAAPYGTMQGHNNGGHTNAGYVPAPAAPVAPIHNFNSGTPPPAGLSYDISSFDPLQAQALQLSASAGLTSLLGQHQQHQAPQPAPLPPYAAAPGIAPAPIQPAPAHANNGGLQPIAPATTAAALSALLGPAAFATAVGSPGGGGGTTTTNAAAAAAATPAAATGAAALALLMQQLQQAGAVGNPLLVQQLAAPLAQAVMAQQQQQQQQQQHQSRAPSAPTAPAPIFPAMVSAGVPGMTPGVPVPAVSATGGIKRALPTGVADVSSVASNASAAMKRPRNDLSMSVMSSSTPPPPQAAAGSATAGASFIGGPGDAGPPKEASQADLDRMTPAERRRYERNLREQLRSYRISQQIKELRDVLSESNVPFKPNKYSILLSVVDYIKQLQSRAIMLDSEHGKLITTIRQTNEMVSSGKAPANTTSDDFNVSNSSDSGGEGDMLFVKGLDYQSIFDQCPAALGIAALDGRILECNAEFQTLLGFPRDDLLKQSLFNLVQNHQDIFQAMAQMLKNAEEPANAQVSGGNDGAAASGKGDSIVPPLSQNRFWTGVVTSKRNLQLLMNITLTVGENGTPKFFSCALTNTSS